MEALAEQAQLAQTLHPSTCRPLPAPPLLSLYLLYALTEIQRLLAVGEWRLRIAERVYRLVWGLQMQPWGLFLPTSFLPLPSPQPQMYPLIT